MIQSKYRILARNIFSNHVKYQLSPCATAIGALLLVCSNTVAWANAETGGKPETPQSKELRLQQQLQEMRQHRQYLLDDLIEVEKKEHQLQSSQSLMGQREERVQELKQLQEQREYLDRQFSQHQTDLQQVEQQIKQDAPSCGMYCREKVVFSCTTLSCIT